MGFFSNIFRNKQKVGLENSEPSKSVLFSKPNLQFYENLIDNIAVSEELQIDLKKAINIAFENPKSFYNDLNEFILSDRGLTFPRDAKLTPKFVLVDKMISALQMTEVDWKEEESEIRLWVNAIAAKKDYRWQIPTEDKYTNDTFKTILSINDNELEPMGYCLEMLDINSDSYVFTIIPLDKKQIVSNMFDKLK